MGVELTCTSVGGVASVGGVEMHIASRAPSLEKTGGHRKAGWWRVGAVCSGRLRVERGAPALSDRYTLRTQGEGKEGTGEWHTHTRSWEGERHTKPSLEGQGCAQHGGANAGGIEEGREGPGRAEREERRTQFRFT